MCVFPCIPVILSQNYVCKWVIKIKIVKIEVVGKILIPFACDLGHAQFR